MGRAGAMRRVAGVIVPFVVLCALLELGFTLLCVYGVIFPQRSMRVFEASERTILFDPVLGVRITPIPSRAARLTDGKVDHVERFEGNAQGFSDRRDFTVKRADGESLRLAVLGDSFSAMKALDILWPERVEDLAGAEAKNVRLLNFSIGGAGLANWWSVLHRVIVADGYELDGVVFAVFDAPEVGDLHRRFLMSDHAHGGVRVGLAPSWDPDTWPKTWADAAPIVTRRSRAILDHETFEQMLRGEYDPTRRRPWRPYLARTLLGDPLNDNDEAFAGGEPTSNDRLMPGPLRLAEELAQTCQREGWPVYVVRVPSREDAMNRTPPSGVLRDFARLFDAEIIDGVDAFREIPAEAIDRDYWLAHDGHWNQRGSDKFAEMMWDRIRAQLPEAPATTSPQTTSR